MHSTNCNLMLKKSFQKHLDVIKVAFFHSKNGEHKALDMMWKLRFKTLKSFDFQLSIISSFWVSEMVIPNEYHFLFNLPFPSTSILTQKLKVVLY